jgi:hypothetical protein
VAYIVLLSRLRITVAWVGVFNKIAEILRSNASLFCRVVGMKDPLLACNRLKWFRVARYIEKGKQNATLYLSAQDSS